MWFMLTLISLLSFCYSLKFVEQLRQTVHHSIDTLYFSLALVIIMPAFLMGSYSIVPSKLHFDTNTLFYYFISGLATWMFYGSFSHLMSVPINPLLYDASSTTRNKRYYNLYTFAVIGIILTILDSVWLKYEVSPMQIIGTVLVILPQVVLDVKIL